MSILNTRTQREYLYAPTITAQDAIEQEEQLYGFGETYSARYGLIKDEAWSVSNLFNNEGFYERADQVETIINTSGKDYSQYQKNGYFDYNRFALDTGLVKTDEQLFTEKVDKLARLREQRQEIIDRGSYWGDIAGSFTGYASDPLIIGTLPFGMVSGTVKGASILSNMARGFATQAAVGFATEVPIQLSVYDYKKQIQSPYSKQEAYTAIASATLFSGLFGGGANGISGYLARRKELAQKAALQFKTFKPIFNDEFTPTVRGIESYKQQQLARAETAEIKALTDLAATRLTPKAVRALEAEQKYLINEQKKELGKLAVKKKKTTAEQKKVAEIKGKYRKKLQSVQKKIDDAKEARAAQTKLENIRQGRVEAIDKDIQEKLVEFSNQPAKKEHTAIFTVEHIVNQLRLRKGFRAEEVALESYQTALNAGIKSVDAIKQAVIKTIDDKINELGTVNPENVKALQEIKGRIFNSTDVKAEMDLILKDNVMRDLDLLRIIDEADSPAPLSKRVVIDKSNVVYPKAKAADLEDQYYTDTGTRESYNRDVSMYNTLETKEVVVLDADGNPKLVNADEVIDDLDNQLGELDSIMRCSRG
jgi:hypothetical protein